MILDSALTTARLYATYATVSKDAKVQMGKTMGGKKIIDKTSKLDLFALTIILCIWPYQSIH